MQYDLLSVWSAVGSVLLAILILLAMVTIHEFGHYLMGKLLKFNIEEFSVGFGPALFKHRSKRTGELFALRLIPLGGYCAFEGEDGLETDADADAETSYARHPGGAYTERAPWRRILVLFAGAFMNYLLALVLILILFSCYGQTMLAVYEVAPDESIPAEYSLHDRDILLSAEGKNLYLTTDLALALNGKKAGDRARLRVSRVVEETEEGARPVREEREVEVILRADVTVKNSSDLDSVWEALGFLYETDGSGEGTYAVANGIYRFGAAETVGRSFVYSFKIAGSIFRVIGELFTGKLGLSALGGPVSTITLTSRVASQSMRSFLEIAAFIGVNLAVFNLLPIPALDGSKIVFTLIEWARGKPISRKVEAVIHAVGFVLLLGFAILVDVLQFV